MNAAAAVTSARATRHGPDPTLVVAAMPEEMVALRRRARDAFADRLEDGTRIERALIEGATVVLACSGDGPAAVSRATRAALESCAPSRAILIGVSGGLRPGLAAGQLLAAREIVAGGRQVPAPDPDLLRRAIERSGAAPAMVLSSSRILSTAAEKAAAGIGGDCGHEEHDAGYPGKRNGSGGLETSLGASDTDAESRAPEAVDLESAAFAIEAARAGVPFLVLRAISDLPGEDLPADFEAFRDASGSLRRGRLVRHALARPALAVRLMGLRRRVALCSRTLADATAAILREEGS